MWGQSPRPLVKAGMTGVKDGATSRTMQSPGLLAGRLVGPLAETSPPPRPGPGRRRGPCVNVRVCKGGRERAVIQKQRSGLGVQ